MFSECRHILTSGHKCKAAALSGQAYCYYHTAAHRYANIRTTSAGPLLLPSTEDTAGVQLAVNQVLRSFATKQIDHRQAGVYFYGLQIAERLARKSNQKPSETIREISEDADGAPIASEKIRCEPPADCVTCGRRDHCDTYDFWEDDVEKLEERLEEESEAAEEGQEVQLANWEPVETE